MWFLCRRKLHELESGLAERMKGFCLLLILMEMAFVERSFGKTSGALDGSEFFFMCFVGLFLEIELVEAGQEAGLGVHQTGQ